MIVDMFTNSCYITSNEILAEKLKSVSLDIMSKIELDGDYRNGKTTFFKYKRLPDDIFGELHEYILNETRKYISEMGAIPEDNMRVDKSWLSLMNKNGNHSLHTHSGASIISGSFYIDINDNHAPISFARADWISDTLKMLKFKEYNTYTSQSYVVPPKKGQLILFKSNIPHEVDTNNEDGRLVVSFNITHWKDD